MINSEVTKCPYLQLKGSKLLTQHTRKGNGTHSIAMQTLSYGVVVHYVGLSRSRLGFYVLNFVISILLMKYV
jgi:hypothetical protein